MDGDLRINRAPRESCVAPAATQGLNVAYKAASEAAIAAASPELRMSVPRWKPALDVHGPFKNDCLKLIGGRATKFVQKKLI